MPWQPAAANAFRSAWMPAPPPESEPAIVRQRGTLIPQNVTPSPVGRGSARNRGSAAGRRAVERESLSRQDPRPPAVHLDGVDRVHDLDRLVERRLGDHDPEGDGPRGEPPAVPATCTCPSARSIVSPYLQDSRAWLFASSGSCPSPSDCHTSGPG